MLKANESVQTLTTLNIFCIGKLENELFDALCAALANNVSLKELNMVLVRCLIAEQ